MSILSVGENTRGRRVQINTTSLRMVMQINNEGSGQSGVLMSEGNTVGEFTADFQPQDTPVASKEESTAGRLARAVSGLASGAANAVSAALKKGVDIRVRELRMLICGECPENQPCVMNTKRCCGKLTDTLNDAEPTCGCVLSLKTKKWGEKCPLGKW